MICFGPAVVIITYMMDVHNIPSRLKYLGFYLCNKVFFGLGAQMNPQKAAFANLILVQLVEAKAYNITKNNHELCHSLICTKTKHLKCHNHSFILLPIVASCGHKSLLLFDQTFLLIQCLDKHIVPCSIYTMNIVK